MQFDAGLTGDAAALARGHAAVLTRLPATVHAFILVELHKWGTLFSAEQRYQRALLDHLTDLPQPELVRVTLVKVNEGVTNGLKPPAGEPRRAMLFLYHWYLRGGVP